MFHLTLVGFLLGAVTLGAADDTWGLSFYSDGACGNSPASFGDSTTWGCYNLDSEVELQSFEWQADDCKFSAEVFFEENCGGDNQLAMSYVCSSANVLRGNTFSSFVIGGPLAHNC
ncbi:hypothetical protein BGW36DRAFT_459665 [Talaromyces proteolyticus]|uniref:Uncharacterized protein n=1 Tax=Talaromyces proteolyticus TaxID=1131652 RepID=A0AAD4L071_9EURO|nr:uncharacterized protein BGW36DRAFT_459665 [Talaromyces proteolyticus]KAH8700499.1 hypothetical protein BGW36DRAFT_459665 [Talaromyces proteolyticus]